MIVDRFDDCKCCGNHINPHHSSRNNNCYDIEYCSNYCRSFVENDYKMVNGQDKTGLKNMSGLEWWPKISFLCEVCGDTYESSKNGNNYFCSTRCCKDLNTKSNIKKVKGLFATFKMMQHNSKYGINGGWMSGINIYEVMNKRGDVAYNTYASVFRLWISKGLIKSRSMSFEGRKITEYKLLERFINKPIGKFMIECRPRRD